MSNFSMEVEGYNVKYSAALFLLAFFCHKIRGKKNMSSDLKLKIETWDMPVLSGE